MVNRHFLIVTLAILGCGLGMPGTSFAGQKPARPNVIILMTDDQGYGDFSCHGNPVLKTPHLDKLYARSARFTDFHSAPMCTPTRGQLLTGVDALRNGATSVTAGRTFLRPGLPTMAELFARAGYRTGIFGKWHLGDNYPHRPMDRGFHKAVYHLGWGFTAAPEFSNTLFDGRYFEDGAEKKFKGYVTDFWFGRAIEWMRERKEKAEPFLCYIPTNAPHAPHTVDPKYAEPYKKQKAANFFGMIANIDENVGRLVQFLKDTGLEENTIVIFMTDNGGTAGVPVYNAGMRGRKTELYEGGHRVPCWVSWPGNKLIRPGDLKLPAQMQDVLPTLLDLCKITQLQDTRFDGTSLAFALYGADKKPPERMLVVQYGQIPKKWDSCVIANKWRLVHGTELYDLGADPEQKKDVAKEKPEVLAKMRDHYEKWWATVEDKLNDFVPTSIGAKQQPHVALTSSDWQNIYSDNAGHVRTAVGGPRGGKWALHVQEDGDYQIALRRWPREIDLPLNGDAGSKSKIITPAAARLTIGDHDAMVKTAPDAKEVVFQLTLKRGPTTMQAWFHDAQGSEICGAFYAYVAKKK